VLPAIADVVGFTGVLPVIADVAGFIGVLPAATDVAGFTGVLPAIADVAGCFPGAVVPSVVPAVEFGAVLSTACRLPIPAFMVILSMYPPLPTVLGAQDTNIAIKISTNANDMLRIFK
jgi:hypothetical protein